MVPAAELTNAIETALRTAKQKWKASDTGKSTLEELQAAEVSRAVSKLLNPLEWDGPKIWVPGIPLSYGKGRTTVRVSRGPLKRWMESIGWEWRRQQKESQIRGPVHLRMRFRHRRRDQDLDNMTKAVLDGLKRVAFGDDNLVYQTEEVKEPAASADDCGVEIGVKPYRGPVFDEHLT